MIIEASKRQTLRPVRLARSRTSPFHGGNTGSNPVRDAFQSQPHTAVPSLNAHLLAPLLSRDVVYDQFSTQPLEPLPPQAVIDPGGAITGIVSNTLVGCGKVGSQQNVELPQLLGTTSNPTFSSVNTEDDEE